MDIQKFIEIVSHSSLPFVYFGDRLNEEKCKKAIKKIGADSETLAVITGDGPLGIDGIAVSKDGIRFSIYSGKMGSMLKTKGTFLFDQFIIHDISIKKTFTYMFDVTIILWDINKKKSVTFQFGLAQDDLDYDVALNEELTNILETLASKTGTEYVSPYAADIDSSTNVHGQIKSQNEYDFVWGKIHTTIAVDDGNIIIKKAKIDKKTKIQTPKGQPVTIARNAIDSVKYKRMFSSVPLLSGMAIGAAIGFGIIGGVYVFLIGVLIGFICSFPKTMIIFRKDGSKFKTVISGDVINTQEYERLINVLFK